MSTATDQMHPALLSLAVAIAQSCPSAVRIEDHVDILRQCIHNGSIDTKVYWQLQVKAKSIFEQQLKRRLVELEMKCNEVCKQPSLMTARNDKRHECSVPESFDNEGQSAIETASKDLIASFYVLRNELAGGKHLVASVERTINATDSYLRHGTQISHRTRAISKILAAIFDGINISNISTEPIGGPNVALIQLFKTLVTELARECQENKATHMSATPARHADFAGLLKVMLKLNSAQISACLANTSLSVPAHVTELSTAFLFTLLARCGQLVSLAEFRQNVPTLPMDIVVSSEYAHKDLDCVMLETEGRYLADLAAFANQTHNRILAGTKANQGSSIVSRRALQAALIRGIFGPVNPEHETETVEQFEVEHEKDVISQKSFVESLWDSIGWDILCDDWNAGSQNDHVSEISS